MTAATETKKDYLRALPGDDVRQILWRFSDRYDLQMLVQSVRAVARGMNPLDMTARDVMTSPAVTVTPDTKVEDCADTLADKRVRRVPVVDDDGACSGMISQADLAQHAPEKLTSKVLRTVSEPI